MYRFACKRVGRQSAEDVAQDVFVSVLRALQHGSLADLNAYSARATYRACALHCRRQQDRRVTPRPLPDGLIADGGSQPPSSHSRTTDLAWTAAALPLTEKEQTLFCYCVREDFSLAQACVDLSVTSSNLFRMARNIGEKLRVVIRAATREMEAEQGPA
jgi:DNA-directed RNA polymerase specialized sigma24 family protein